MRIFTSSLAEFQYKLLTNELFEQLHRDFHRVVGRSVGPRESHSWRASIPRLDHVLRLAKLPENVWIAIEQTVPYYSKRIDAVLFGCNKQDSPNMVIVELKAWSEAKALPDGNIETFMHGAATRKPHPSEQVGAYHDHLLDFCKAFHGERAIELSSIAYCHNYRGVLDQGLFHPQFNELRARSPLFVEHDAARLAEYLYEKLAGGRGEMIVNAFDEAGLGPSKQLIDHAGDMIRQQNVFRLLDEQIAANNAILRAVRQANQKRRKQVILVRGGPGTGKSVIALNAFGEALRKELTVYLASGSAAFTWSFRKLLGNRLKGFVHFTDYFWNFEANSIDVLIVDEAHRVREKSTPRVPSEQRPKINQIEELLRAAKVIVLFADENQIISPVEIGEPALIEETARKLNARFEQHKLPSQFRCNGSDAYMTWLDDVLGLTPEDQGIKLSTSAGLNFKIVKMPHELLAEVRHLNVETSNSARLVSGWCWPWNSPNEDGSLVEDIVIGDFRFPWEAKNGSKPATGIPEAKLWAIDPAGVDQAGTVYSMQGFEARHVGVIIGPDLVRRNGEWIAQPQYNYSNGLRRRHRDMALPYIKRIYRTLLSRAMNSCSVFCVDEETRQYFESRLIRESSQAH
jgi:hypothetical protein